jgi:hypothetical protein
MVKWSNLDDNTELIWVVLSQPDRVSHWSQPEAAACARRREPALSRAAAPPRIPPEERPSRPPNTSLRHWRSPP